MAALNEGRGGTEQPPAYTKGDANNVKVGTSETAAYSNNTHTVDGSAFDLSSAAWTKVTDTKYVSGTQDFYVALNGGTSSANTGITDVNNAFKVTASVSAVNR